jgi:hypothetical protein
MVDFRARKSPRFTASSDTCLLVCRSESGTYFNKPHSIHHTPPARSEPPLETETSHPWTAGRWNSACGGPWFDRFSDVAEFDASGRRHPNAGVLRPAVSSFGTPGKIIAHLSPLCDHFPSQILSSVLLIAEMWWEWT